MIRGIYTSASGMDAQLTAQEIISNNLANVDTVGYKKDMPIKSSFASLLLNRFGDRADRGMAVVIGNLGTGAKIDGAYTDLSDGPLKYTENRLDLAIVGNGFFVIQVPEGERYTRNGSFSISPTGDLVTKDGFAVMGHRGVVNLTSSEVRFNEDGSVVQDGLVINELRIITVDNPLAMRKIGQNLFALREGFTADDARDFRVLQGYLESSNVNVVSEMIKMISGLRLYEANQKTIDFQNQTLDKLINEAARV